MAPAQPFPAARGKSSAYRELHQLDGVEILHVAADMEFLRRDGRRPCTRILISRGPSSDIWRRVSGDHRVQFGVRPIKHSSLSAVVALALLFAAPLFAGEQGITPKETVEIMLADALPAKIDKDGRGNVIVRSRVSDINFDVYFLACTVILAAPSSRHRLDEQQREQSPDQRVEHHQALPASVFQARQGDLGRSGCCGHSQHEREHRRLSGSVAQGDRPIQDLHEAIAGGAPANDCV